MPPPQAAVPFLIGQPAPTWVRRPKEGHPLRATLKRLFGVYFFLPKTIDFTGISEVFGLEKCAAPKGLW